ncbi:MAG: hypothetical protein HY879_23220 [Deltaproteobacteria bacterium]|nr:hypothetical protein [Deltaproteobacteria bacterium]
MERALQHYEQERRAGALEAARLLLASAVTSPRLGGVGEVVINLIQDPAELEDLALTMEDLAKENQAWSFFTRDAAMLRSADAVLVMSSMRSLDDPADINCGYCGLVTCENFRAREKLPNEPGVAFTGPLCYLRVCNVAYALGGAASLAEQLGVDYTILFSAALAARRNGHTPRRSGFSLAIAISVTEKSPFRDMPKKSGEINERTMQDRIINRLWPQFRSIYS